MTDRPALPAVLEEIAQVAGLEAAWALANARGGTWIFLPRHVGSRHWLSAIVGYEAAQKICRHFRSNHQERVLVPMATRTQMALRWEEARARGLSLNETALLLGKHVRTVSRYRAREQRKDQDDQGELF